MILLDYSQVAISNLHQQLKPDSDEASKLEPALLRHMILNSIRKCNREWSRQYGQMVLCTDNQQYWRKELFPYYKANRKKDRDKSNIDWALVFDTLNTLRDEIREIFPYKVLNVPMAEADDIIGVIAKYYHKHEGILIISGDKDFKQLQRYPNVEQYAPVQDKMLKAEPTPALYLKEHIIRGDKGDGVPNFLSNDDCLVTGVRQASIFETKLSVWLTQEPEAFCDERMLANYRRNEKLLDLAFIPADVEIAIIEEFNKPIIGNKSKIFSYLIKNRMKNLLESANEF